MNIVEYTLRAHGVNYGKAKPLAEYGRYVLTTGNYRQQAELVKGIDGAFKLRNRRDYHFRLDWVPGILNRAVRR